MALFGGASGVTFFVMPWLVPWFFRRYGGRPSELEAKLLLLTLFGLDALALWAGSEPVLPAYILGMILAGTVGKDHALVRRLRTLTFGLLTPLLMSTGLTFGSISALFGLTHHVITLQQYSYLIAAVIGSAIVPTLIANAFFLPRHLIRSAEPEVAAQRAGSGCAD